MKMEQQFAPHTVQVGDITIALRPREARDADFLMRLYSSVRWPEFAAVGWPQAVLQQFLAGQYRLQSMQYEGNCPGIEQWIVELEGQEIGRFYLWPAPDELRIVDISLLPEWRGKGIGSALIELAAGRAHSLQLPLRLSVTRESSALRLYLRLGFRVIADQDVYLRMERPIL